MNLINERLKDKKMSKESLIEKAQRMYKGAIVACLLQFICLVIWGESIMGTPQAGTNGLVLTGIITLYFVFYFFAGKVDPLVKNLIGKEQ